LDGDEPGDDGREILDGDEYVPSVPKKIRRHSTPWLSSSTDSTSDNFESVTFPRVAKKIVSTPCLNMSATAGKAEARAASMPFRTAFENAEGLYGSATAQLDLDHAEEIDWPETAQSDLDHRRRNSSSRFDPLGGNSSHSRDMMQPPMRQPSNHDLLEAFDRETGNSNSNISKSNNPYGNFANVSSSSSKSSLAPIMPMRRESFLEDMATFSDDED
jgi:hypothetical protein